MMRAIRNLVLLLSVTTFTACGESGTGNESPRAVVTSGPTDIELIPGGSKFIVYSVERIAGHSGAVQLSVNGVPEGVLARFHPPVVTNGALVSSLEVTVSPTASSGTYTFTTVATGEGVQATSIPVTVTIVVPGVALTAAPVSLAMQQGKSASTTLNLSRAGGFAGVVGLTLTNVPAGVTASLSSATFAGNETAVTLTTTAALDAPVGSYAITVTAASAGIATRSISVPVTVTEGTTPAVMLSASPSSLAIARGATAQVTLNAARFAGFTGAVSVAVEVLPADVTAVVAPIAPGQTSTTMLLTAGANAAAPQASTLTLRASGTGIEDTTIPLTVMVLEAPTFRFNFNRLGAMGPYVGSLGVEVPRGTTVFVGGAIDRISGFSDAVTVSIVGLPQGFTFSSFIYSGSFPISVPSSTAASQGMSLSVNVAADVAPGTYQMTMRGVASSGLVAEAPVVILVQ